MIAGDTGELPEGWESVPLREVASARLGKMLDAAKQGQGRRLPYLRNINVRWDEVDLSDLLTMSFTEDEERDFDLRPGDVLVCEGGEPGRAAIWQQVGAKIKFQKALHRVRLGCGITPQWLVCHLRHDALSGNLEEYFTGSTIKHFTGVALAKYLLKIPPLAEQRRIVAAVERVLRRVSAARDRLNRVPATLKRFRQAVLAAACSGRLTAEAAKDKVIEVKALATLRSSGQLIAEEDRQDIPEHWQLIPATDLFDWSSGKNLTGKSMVSGPYLVYGGNGVSGNHSEYLIDEATLVIGRVGALCGNVYLAEPKCWVTDNAIYTKRASNSVYLPFARIVFENAQLNRRSGGSGQPFVNQPILNAVGVPVPPLPEQRVIVRRVDELFALADAIESKLTVARRRVERLTQAVLAKAFHGELVPTEAELARRDGRDYEPASALLARIQAEREQASSAVTKPKKVRRTRP
jgi:type I restriction enzyme S subunit